MNATEIRIGCEGLGSHDLTAQRGSSDRYQFKCGTGYQNGAAVNVVSFEYMGFRVLTCDKDMTRELIFYCRDCKVESLNKLMEDIVMQELAKRPGLLEQRLENAFQAGIKQGRRDKAYEMRQVLDEY